MKYLESAFVSAAILRPARAQTVVPVDSITVAIEPGYNDVSACTGTC
jgi:hypothetical protein